jgi:medium-chain acyl-[acyl-carrier-protein] hydrolase
LSNIRIRFYDLPGYLNRCTITTWPSGLSRLLADREFIVCDDAGQELARASSEWLVMQGKTGRSANLLTMDLHLPQKPEKVFDTPLKRLKLPDTDRAMQRSLLKLIVPFSALDVNGHVNNAQYVKWAVDALYQMPAGSLTVEALQITYLSEVFEKNEIEIFSAAHRGTGGLGLTGINRSTGKAAFHGVFVLNPDQ